MELFLNLVVDGSNKQGRKKRGNQGPSNLVEFESNFLEFDPKKKYIFKSFCWFRVTSKFSAALIQGISLQCCLLKVSISGSKLRI